MKTVVIIGGGITGVSAAYYLNQAIQANKLEAKIVLVEASEELGGKIRTVRDGEFVMETGADSIVTRKTNVAPLLAELGIEDKVVYNATGKSYIYTDGRLKPIPEEAVFGIPLSIESLATSELVSAEGKVEALKDFYTTNETFTKTDSVGRFLEAFLGRELVEKQIAPVLSGVYSGELNDLTIASTLPYLLEYKNQYGSIIKGLAENRQKFKGGSGKKFLSFANGMADLLDALERSMPEVQIEKGTKAVRLEKTSAGRYRLAFDRMPELEADYVVLSTPHTAAQPLLKDEQLDAAFGQLLNTSLISVYLAFDVADEELPLDGTGFIVAESGDVRCNACTWTSRKWTHTSANSRLLVRLFYKSSKEGYEELQRMTEQELLAVALKDIEASMGIAAKPVTHNVTKWHEKMPNYHIKHHELVNELETAMAARFPNVLLAGCSYYGVGIPDCIANGEKTAGVIAVRLAE